MTDGGRSLRGHLYAWLKEKLRIHRFAVAIYNRDLVTGQDFHVGRLPDSMQLTA